MKYLITICLGLLVSAQLFAKDCGNGVDTCACGDNVIADYWLNHDIICGESDNIGLTIGASGIKLYGPKENGQLPLIIRNVRPKSKTVYGILLPYSTNGSTISMVKITQFTRGVHIEGGSKNVISQSEIFSNGYNTDANNNSITPIGYGIDLSTGSSKNRIENNIIRDNYDEGIHVGSKSFGIGNVISGNQILNNGAENIYVLGAVKTKILNNVISGCTQNSIHIDHGSKTRIIGNDIRDCSLMIKGFSNSNIIKNNTFKNTSINLAKWEQGTPSNNKLINATFTDPNDCRLAIDRFKMPDFVKAGNRYRKLSCQ